VTQISETIHGMFSGDNFTTDISETLPLTNVNEADRSSNTVNYNRQTMMNNDQCSGLEYREGTLSYLALDSMIPPVRQLTSLELVSLSQVHSSLRNLTTTLIPITDISGP
jgi:hypothetical protein